MYMVQIDLKIQSNKLKSLEARILLNAGIFCIIFDGKFCTVFNKPLNTAKLQLLENYNALAEKKLNS